MRKLSANEKRTLVRRHENGDTAKELAKVYRISPQSVAAYVANAHR